MNQKEHSAAEKARTLYQFPISHYCEKSRWNLDAKGLSYRIVNLVPGLHKLTTHRLANTGTVPLLMDQGKSIGDSTDIAIHLDKMYPSPAMIPNEPSARTRVLELEEKFDHFGDHVRRWMYGQSINAPGLAPAMFRSYSWFISFVSPLLEPFMRRGLRKLYRLTPENVHNSQMQMLKGLDLLEEVIEGNPDRYLAGDRLTIADITASSLYGPLVGPKGSPWEQIDNLPSIVIDMREKVRNRIAGQWMMRVYQNDRKCVQTTGE